MKLKLLLAFTVFILHPKTVKAQETIPAKNSFLDKTEFKAAYFGEIFWSQGLNVGAEYLWKEHTKVKQVRGKEKTITNQLLLNGTIGFTFNPNNKTDTGVFTHYGLIWRRTNKKGKQFSLTLNPLGYYRSFLPETYEVNGDNVSKVSLPGRGYYAPSIGVGIGRFRKDKKIVGRYLNINYMVRTPYNAGSLPSFYFEYGFRFNLKKKKR